MTTGYAKNITFIKEAISESIADIVPKLDGTYMLCAENRQVIYLSDELKIIKTFEVEKIDETKVQRCLHLRGTLHGNLLIQGYYESPKIGIYKESSSILASDNLQKI